MGGRDPRIDFFRGLVLLLIFSSHLNPNFLKKFLPNSWGLSDGAEVFVFLSGYVCAFSYRKTLASGGLLATQAKALARCFEIYATQAVTLVLLLAALGALSPSYPWAVEAARAGLFLSRPAEAYSRFAVLGYFPWCFEIMAMYFAFLTTLPAMLWLGVNVSLRAMVLTSALPYLAVQFAPEVVRLPPPWWQAWYFRPLAWQFLFALGMAWALRASRPGGWAPYGRSWVAAAATLVALGVVGKVAYSAWVQPGYFEDLFAVLARGEARPLPMMRHHLPGTDKPTLGPLRLAFFLCLVYLCAYLVPRAGRWWGHPVARAVSVCGQHSLPVFYLGVLLVNVANVLLQGPAGRPGWQLVANGVGWLALVLFALALRGFRAVLKARRHEATQEAA
ncbi:MAG: OpgC domain-containing protein [Gemmataceae bacterium]